MFTKQSLHHFSTLAVIILMILGCEGPVGPKGENGSLLTGKISGFVFLVDPDTIYTDYKDVQITVENTNFSATTDSKGKWVIDNLPTGTYNFLINKNGFGEYRYISVQFVGGGEYYIGSRYLTSIPYLPLSIDITFTTTNDFRITTFLHNKIEGVAGYPQLFFFGLNDSVSSDPKNYKYVETYFASSDSVNNLFLSLTYLKSRGFKSGDTIYLAAYASIMFWYQPYGNYMSYNYFSYIDINTGKLVYTNLGEKSNVLSFKIP